MKKENYLRLPRIVESREIRKHVPTFQFSKTRHYSPVSFRSYDSRYTKPTKHYFPPYLKINRKDPVEKSSLSSASSSSVQTDELKDTFELTECTNESQAENESQKLDNNEESYESFIERIHERQDSPLPANRIWSSNMINSKQMNYDSHKKIKEKLKLASFLSNEAVYALLKSYDDLLYLELRQIYPTSQKITRMNTQAYINLPKLEPYTYKNHQEQQQSSSSTEHNHEQHNNNHDQHHHYHHHSRHQNNHDDHHNEFNFKREYMASRQLEHAMEIFDEIKRRKGELTGRSSYHTDDLIGDYENWKKNCYAKLRI